MILKTNLGNYDFKFKTKIIIINYVFKTKNNKKNNKIKYDDDTALTNIFKISFRLRIILKRKTSYFEKKLGAFLLFKIPSYQPNGKSFRKIRSSLQICFMPFYLSFLLLLKP